MKLPERGPEAYWTPEERRFYQRGFQFPEELPERHKSWVSEHASATISDVPTSALAKPESLSAIAAIQLQNLRWANSTAATDLAASTVSAVDDPAFRQIANLRGVSKCRLLGRLGGTVAAANKLLIQYHPGGDPLVASGDAGWATLHVSAGGHTTAVTFYTAEGSIPSAARLTTCILRAVLFDGDGAADPTIRQAILHVYS